MALYVGQIVTAAAADVAQSFWAAFAADSLLLLLEKGCPETIRKDKPKVLFEAAEIHKAQVFRFFNDLNFQLCTTTPLVPGDAPAMMATPPAPQRLMI